MSIPVSNTNPLSSQPVNPSGSTKEVAKAADLLESTSQLATKVLEDANVGESFYASAKRSPNEKSSADAATIGKETAKAAETLATAQAALETDEELKTKKLKKKKTPLEEKLDELGALEGMIDEKAVKKEEDKNIIKDFFSNLSRLKNLRGRLKQLEKEEQYYEDLLKEQEEKKEKKEKDKR